MLRHSGFAEDFPQSMAREGCPPTGDSVRLAAVSGETGGFVLRAGRTLFSGSSLLSGSYFLKSLRGVAMLIALLMDLLKKVF
jgi:hypothetical protein